MSKNLLNAVGMHLGSLPILRNSKCKQIGSYDRTGGNADFIRIKPKETVELVKVKGAGCFVRLWVTISSPDKYILRKAILRMYWDGEKNPSVECPLGDFFGVGFAEYVHYSSLLMGMSSGGYYCYIPMPFSTGAKMTLTNDSAEVIQSFYYNFMYQEFDELDNNDNIGRFHAFWKREKQTVIGENYVLLEAKGRGHYLGCNLSMQNYRKQDISFLEGDEMIFVDGEPFPPAIHGTGTEDYFNAGWYYNKGTFASPYHGLTVKDEKLSRISTFRFHLEDAVPFQNSIRVTIEHSHANEQSQDYSSTAYWYQTEPHQKFPLILKVEDRVPLEDLMPKSHMIEDFCRKYWVIGPFPNPKWGKKRLGLDTPYPPEQEIKFKKTYPGKKGLVTKWQEVETNPNGVLDFIPLWSEKEMTVAYALTYVYSSVARDARLLIGSDDGVKVWVNGKVVHQIICERSALPDMDSVPVQLKAGWNKILLKVENNLGGWGVILRVVASLGEMKFSTTIK
ncbi:MAG: DUF2961 domain-containing protein [bacterium]|nr:DUF2961 domain-containing protein [bacterium]